MVFLAPSVTFTILSICKWLESPYVFTDSFKKKENKKKIEKRRKEEKKKKEDNLLN